MAIVLCAIEERQKKVPDGLLELFRLAQKVLPPARQRKVRTVSEIPWFEEMLNQKLAERSARDMRSDPAIPVIREASAVQQKFLDEILTQLREQNDLLRQIAERKC